MADDLIKYQCPACGGPLHFNANDQKLVCEFCDSKFPEDYFDSPSNNNEVENHSIDWKKDGFVKELEKMENQCGFNCTSCGAEIISDGNTAATECMYCGNPIVLSDNVSGMVKPDMLIPFKIDKDHAEEMLKEFYNNKILLPNAFKDENRIKKIAGMYIPFWLFSGKGSGKVSYNAEKVRTWSDSNYNYTETSYYRVVRSGSALFQKIPADASSKMDDAFMDGLEPFDYSELTDFTPSYMAGYFADKFDVNVDVCAPRAVNRVINSTKDALKSTVKGYSLVNEKSSNVDMYDEEVKYTMLPVWMLNTKYNDKMYQFAINGQTGKVSGALPIDKKKQILFFVLTVIAVYIPLAFIGFQIIS